MKKPSASVKKRIFQVDSLRSRPDMPVSYGIDRELSPKMMSWSKVRYRLAKARNYWIVTASLEGQVHAAPVWGIWANDTFCFSTDLDSRKGHNLATNPNLVVHLESGDNVVILEGTAEPVTNRSVLVKYADSYELKYRIRPRVKGSPSGVYRVKPGVALAWSEKNFTESATRWQFL